MGSSTYDLAKRRIVVIVHLTVVIQLRGEEQVAQAKDLLPWLLKGFRNCSSPESEICVSCLSNFALGVIMGGWLLLCCFGCRVVSVCSKRLCSGASGCWPVAFGRRLQQLGGVGDSSGFTHGQQSSAGRDSRSVHSRAAVGRSQGQQFHSRAAVERSQEQQFY